MLDCFEVLEFKLRSASSCLFTGFVVDRALIVCILDIPWSRLKVTLCHERPPVLRVLGHVCLQAIDAIEIEMRWDDNEMSWVAHNSAVGLPLHRKWEHDKSRQARSALPTVQVWWLQAPHSRAFPRIPTTTHATPILHSSAGLCILKDSVYHPHSRRSDVVKPFAAQAVSMTLLTMTG